MRENRDAPYALDNKSTLAQTRAAHAATADIGTTLVMVAKLRKQEADIT
jgi:hypothetical protein